MSYKETQYGKFSYFGPDSIGQAIARGEFWDGCNRPYMDVLAQGDVYVDIGANIGFYPVYLGRRGIVCHAFEASKEVFVLLEANIRDNHLESTVTLYNEALYDSERELAVHKDWRTWAVGTDVAFDYERTGNSGWLCLVPDEIGDSFAKFHAHTLDSHNIQNVKLIKVDTQGCDLRILYGSRKTIEQWKPVVLFEYEAMVSVCHGDTFDKYQAFFQELNYDVTQIGGVEYVAQSKG